MITVKPNITQKLEIDIVTDDGRDINDILKEISEIAHDGITYASMIRQDVEGCGFVTEKCEAYQNALEICEGKLCSILDLLKD